MESPNTPSGLGGWLVLPILGLLVAPFALGALLLTTYGPIFDSGGWDFLTTPGSEYYHPLWAPLLIFEIAGNFGLLVFSIILLVFFFQKNAAAPKAMIAFLIINFLFVTIDLIAADFIPMVSESTEDDAMEGVVRAGISALIWIPYFLRSKRVKNTFIHRMVPSSQSSER